MTQKTIAVVYSSKYGTTKTICETIKEHSDNNTTFDLFCLDKGEQPDLNNYNHIIIGTSVYAGHPRAKVVAFCQSNIEAKETPSLSVCVRNGQSKCQERNGNRLPFRVERPGSATQIL